MADDLQSIVERMIAAGESEGDIAGVIQHYGAITAPAASPATPAAPEGLLGRAIGTIGDVAHGLVTHPLDTLEGFAKGAGGAIQTGAGILPTVGGVAGGIVGGVPGAAAGGAAGAGIRDLVQHVTELPGAVADVAGNLVAHPAATLAGFAGGAGSGAVDAGTNAAINAAGEGIGNVLAKGAGVLGKSLMGDAAKPTLALAREFPDLSQTMLDNALTVSKGGLSKARQLLYAAKADANSALDAAHEAGAAVPITAATAGLQKTFNDLAVNSSDPVGALSRLATLEQKLTQGRGATLTMREADALKQSLQAEARNLYKAQSMGNSSRTVAIDAVAKSDMAHALNQAIEDAAVGAGQTGYKAANQQAQDLIGATRAISRRVLQGGNSTASAIGSASVPALLGQTVAGGPGAIALGAGAIAGKAATTPASLSKLALLFSHPLSQDVLRQLPIPVLQGLAGLLGATSGGSSSPPAK